MGITIKWTSLASLVKRNVFDIIDLFPKYHLAEWWKKFNFTLLIIWSNVAEMGSALRVKRFVEQTSGTFWSRATMEEGKAQLGCEQAQYMPFQYEFTFICFSIKITEIINPGDWKRDLAKLFYGNCSNTKSIPCLNAFRLCFATWYSLKYNNKHW